MLIVHPSSQCDVCLDPYSWEEETTLRNPYAIPCGHIFCKLCLESVQSEQCPLCRKRFHKEHIKKLHMDPPPENDESMIIRKFVMAWDDEVEVVNALEEVDRWLERTESGPLIQLKKVQAEHQKLKARKADDRYRIKRLETSLMHLERSHGHDREMALGLEASYTTTIDGLQVALSQSQSEVQSLRNQLTRMEFNSSSRRDKGKGKARATNYTPDGDPLQANPLPAPPAAVPMERYATIAGDVRSSSVEAEQVAAAIEASLVERRGRDGYSSDVGTSSAGPSRSRDNTYQSNTALQGSEIIGYSQHYVEPSAQAYPPKPRSHRSSRPEALPIVLDTAVSQAQQYASRSSPSRKTRIVPGASNEGDRIYVPPGSSQWPPAGSQSTFANGYASASVPPVPSSAPVESHRKRHGGHKSKHRREERSAREGGEAIVGVTGLGLIDESLEERRNNPQAAFVDGYMEGLNNGFGYGTARTGATPGPIASAPAAPAARVRFTAAAQSISPPASAAPATSHQSRPQALRRSTTTATQNVAPADGLADRLRNLMEDPNRPPVDRASVVPSEAPSWGTVTSNSSRRQSGASDVLATLRSFPAHASRSSISSTEIPVGDPSAFLPAVPANRAPTQTQNTNPDRDGAPLSSAPSIPEASSRSAHRSNDHQVNQSTGPVTSRPVNHRLTSLPVNSSNTTNGNGSTRPRPSHMASMPFPGATTANNSYTPAYTNGSAYPNHNPLPTLPNFGGYTNSSSLGSAPPRALIHEYNSSPAVPNVNTVQSRASNANSATPVGNSLGLELGNDGEDRRNGYSPIPAFAAPTPRASHGLFLRAFSFDGYETEGTLYR